MNRYLKLVNFEINRFMKLYLVLVIMTIVLQFAAVIVESLRYVHRANEAIFTESISKAQFIADNGLMNFTQICKSLLFLGPVAISATVMLVYVFFIWYRDWFAKNTFIYRLLMLPTSRLNIYFSKASAILLFVIGLIALELIIMPLEISLFEKLVPSDFRLDYPLTGIISGFTFLNLIIPASFIQFLLYYGMGLMAVLILFTGILFERSFGWKGILMAIVYAVASILLFLFPVILMAIFQGNIFYPEEFLGIEIGLGFLVILIQILVSHFLLKKKITV